jgi:nitrogen fixation NifU-like protein
MEGISSMPSSIRDNPDLLREIIMDHYQNPRNRKETADPRYLTVHMDSASCIDDIYLQLLVVEGKITDCLWHGKGCAISTASTSIMTTLIKGKTLAEAKDIMDNFQKMLREEPFDEDKLGEAIAFVNTYRQPSRVSCATIGWRGLEQLMEKEEEDEHQGK